MKILLTNDDGYQAPNIQHLFKKLSEEHDVWIIAPENNCSGMSAAISFLKETEIRKVEERIYAVDGTPADCTYFGLLGIVDFEFDMETLSNLFDIRFEFDFTAVSNSINILTSFSRKGCDTEFIVSRIMKMSFVWSCKFVQIW